MDFLDNPDKSFDKELDKTKIINLLSSNITRVLKDKVKDKILLEILLYVCHQVEIYFNKSGQGSIKKSIVIELLKPYFPNEELLESSLEFILKTNKIFKKKLVNKFKNYIARRNLKKKLNR